LGAGAWGLQIAECGLKAGGTKPMWRAGPARETKPIWGARQAGVWDISCETKPIVAGALCESPGVIMQNKPNSAAGRRAEQSQFPDGQGRSLPPT